MNPSAEQHLAKAKEYIAKGDEFYRKAKPEIERARAEGASVQEICSVLQKSERWVYDVLAWDGSGTLYGYDSKRRELSRAKQVLRDAEPETIADFLDDRAIKTNIAAASRVHEFRQENRTGIPARNAAPSASFISLVVKVNGWLDELIGMVEAGEGIPDEFSTQSLVDMGRKVMRLQEIVDDARESEGVESRV